MSSDFGEDPTKGRKVASPPHSDDPKLSELGPVPQWVLDATRSVEQAGFERGVQAERERTLTHVREWMADIEKSDGIYGNGWGELHGLSVWLEVTE